MASKKDETKKDITTKYNHNRCVSFCNTRGTTCTQFFHRESTNDIDSLFILQFLKKVCDSQAHWLMTEPDKKSSDEKPSDEKPSAQVSTVPHHLHLDIAATTPENLLRISRKLFAILESQSLEDKVSFLPWELRFPDQL